MADMYAPFLKELNKQYLNKTKLFEKIEIDWFSISDLKRKKKEFRGFYQNIVDLFLEDIENIISFAKSKVSKMNKTRKTY
jgi:hypothetical protein